MDRIPGGGNLINPTLSVVPDIGEDLRKIDIAERAVVVKITAVGRQAHGASRSRDQRNLYDERAGIHD